jgi:hypothetical protein
MLLTIFYCDGIFGCYNAMDPKTWHMVGAGALVGAAEPSPGQVWPALASCGRLWPAAAGSGTAAVGSGQLRPAVVRPSLAMCGRTSPGAAGPGSVRLALHLCFGAAL